MQIDSNEVRKAMRGWATGVTVVTAQHQGTRHGMTVSAFTSASLNPPLLLVSVAHDSRTHAMIAETGCFGVTILSSEQQAIAECFSGQGCEDESRFVGLETFALQTGVPLFAGGLACFDCRVVAAHETGTNTLFIGEVVAVKSTDDAKPLLYFNRAYRFLAS